jgi:hypothetical protein
VFAVTNFGEDSVDLLDITVSTATDGSLAAHRVFKRKIVLGGASVSPKHPSSLAYLGDDTYIVSNSAANSVQFFKGTGELTQELPVGAKPNRIAFGNGLIVVTNNNGASVTAIDIRGKTFETIRQDIALGQLDTREIPVGAFPIGVAFGNDRFVVANFSSGTVSVLQFDDGPGINLTSQSSFELPTAAPTMVFFGGPQG